MMNIVFFCAEMSVPSRDLLVQSQQWKRKNSVESA